MKNTILDIIKVIGEMNCIEYLLRNGLRKQLCLLDLDINNDSGNTERERRLIEIYNSYLISGYNCEFMNKAIF